MDGNGNDVLTGEQRIRNFNINFGPQHPAAHGVLRLVLELDGEIVERCDPHIGLLHRGTEKLMESRTYLQNLPYLDRLDYVAPMNQEHAWCLAIERLTGTAISRRASLIRVLYSEIGRILNHLLNVTTQAMDVGALTPPLWGFEEREKLMIFYERACGARLHAAYFRPGGVHQDLPPDLIDDIAAWARAFPAGARRHRDADHREPHLQAAQRRHRRGQPGGGAGAAASPASWCAVRGSPGTCGASQPYECYDEFDFKIPLGRNGDCYDRYLCRMWEMRESTKIILQAVEKLDATRGEDVLARGKLAAAAARRDEELDGGADPSLQALHRGLPRPRRRGLCRGRGAQGRVRRLPGRRRHQQAVQGEAAGARAIRTSRRWTTSAGGTCWPTSRRRWARSTSCSGRSTDETCWLWPGRRRAGGVRLHARIHARRVVAASRRRSAWTPSSMLVEGTGCRAATRRTTTPVLDPAGFSDAEVERRSAEQLARRGARRDHAGGQPRPADGELPLMLRRLHHEQPAHFAFTPANLAWAEAQIAKYPEGRQASAVIPLLWRAQEQEGWVSRPAIEAIAADARHGLHPGARGRDVLLHVPAATGWQRCACPGLRHDVLHDLRRRGPDRGLPAQDRRRTPHELSADGRFSWEEVECLGACANAPMAQIGKDYYEDLTAGELRGVCSTRSRAARCRGRARRTAASPPSRSAS